MNRTVFYSMELPMPTYARNLACSSRHGRRPGASSEAASHGFPSIRIVAVLLATALPLSGCSSRPKETAANEPSTTTPPPARTTASKSSTSKTNSVEVVRISGVNLLEPGEEPRRLLRYTHESGSSIKGNVESTLLFTTVTEGRRQTVPKPGASIRVRIDTPEVSAAAGKARRLVHVEQLSVLNTMQMPAALQAQVQANLRKVEGIVYEQWADAMGRFDGVRLTSEDASEGKSHDLMASMAQMLGRIAIVFPEEPVGLGGKWRVIMRFEEHGMELEQTAVYDLIELDSEGGKVRVSLTHSVPTPSKTPFGIAETREPELVSFEASGAGEQRFRFSHPVATGELTTTSNARIRMRKANNSDDVEEQELSLELVCRFVPPTVSEQAEKVGEDS